MAYTVNAKRWEHGWELHIDGIGVTQSACFPTPKQWSATTWLLTRFPTPKPQR